MWLTNQKTQYLNKPLLPDIKVKPPGSTTPADVSTVPLVVEDDCQEGALVCMCMDGVPEEEEDDDGVDCVAPGRLDTVKAGFIWSCRRTGRIMLRQHLTLSTQSAFSCSSSQVHKVPPTVSNRTLTLLHVLRIPVQMYSCSWDSLTQRGALWTQTAIT